MSPQNLQTYTRLRCKARSSVLCFNLYFLQLITISSTDPNCVSACHHRISRLTRGSDAKADHPFCALIYIFSNLLQYLRLTPIASVHVTTESPDLHEAQMQRQIIRFVLQFI